MQKIVFWIKTHKLTFLLLLIVGYFLFKNFFSSFFGLSLSGSRNYVSDIAYSPMMKLGSTTESVGLQPGALTNSYQQDYAPAPEATNRLVIQESTMSLLVKKVSESQKAITQKAQQLGGYMVTSNVSYPEQAEAASGSVSIRIPQTKLEEALDFFRTLSVKVVSENLKGEDVTDQYVDIEARLATLVKTKTKFEEILTNAQKVEEILQVQREIVNLQQQIDNLKGQQIFLEKSSAMSKITVYLSTDELALPYAPSNAWRPTVIFKQAVRSLIGSLRQIGTMIIWLGVYSVVWVPILLVVLLICWLRRRKNLRSPEMPS